MSLFSKQIIYCNACGKKMLEILPHVIGRTYKVCSLACNREMNWRDTLSTLGKPYTPFVSKRCKDCGSVLTEAFEHLGFCQKCGTARGFFE